MTFSLGSILKVLFCGMLFPGGGQFIVHSYGKGLYFLISLTTLFFFGWFLIDFIDINEPFNAFRIPCIPGITLYLLAKGVTLYFEISPQIEHYHPQYYELGQIILFIVTILNAMVCTEALEQLYQRAKSTQLQLSSPISMEKETKSKKEKNNFLFWFKKIALIFTFLIWLSIFVFGREKLKLLCCFPLCFVVSSIYKACRFHTFYQILQETEKMYLMWSYGLIFLYLTLVFAS